jgi:hypothetical protein
MLALPEDKMKKVFLDELFNTWKENKIRKLEEEKRDYKEWLRGGY